VIEFLCPEGHKIRCPKEKAGRPAKCPKCGVGFRIPTLQELGLTDVEADAVNASVTDDAAGAAVPPLSSPSTKSATSATAPAKERQIQFLCPNEHRLFAPASLQGRAGECPECGSRFVIPVVDEEEHADPASAADRSGLAEEEIRLDHSTPASDAGHLSSVETLESIQVLEGGAGSGQPSRPTGGLSGLSLESTAQSNGKLPARHPLASLFIELWAARDENSRVEIHLESGSVLLPDAYVHSHSQHDYAVLVTRDPDGCSTITVVPWSSISRIILRAIKQVPGEVVR
jgi:hypothetical protein